jgi:hypothetical protein
MAATCVVSGENHGIRKIMYIHTYSAATNYHGQHCDIPRPRKILTAQSLRRDCPKDRMMEDESYGTPIRENILISSSFG